MIDDSFPISCNSINTFFCNVEFNDTWLWHKRFGHYNLRSLVYMKYNVMVLELPIIEMYRDICGSCQLNNNMHSISFPKGSFWRTKEVINIDLCGLMRTTSLSVNNHFVIFVDDMTRITKV